MPIHDCVKTSLENEYFKQKLTEFYKENRRLKEQISLLEKQSDEKTTATAETSTQTTNQAAQQTKASTSCSVCNRPNKPKQLDSSDIKATFDSDIYNKQNKVFN